MGGGKIRNEKERMSGLEKVDFLGWRAFVILRRPATATATLIATFSESACGEDERMQGARGDNRLRWRMKESRVRLEKLCPPPPRNSEFAAQVIKRPTDRRTV